MFCIRREQMPLKCEELCVPFCETSEFPVLNFSDISKFIYGLK